MFLLLILLPGSLSLAGCMDSLTVTLTRVDSWSGQPVELDPADVAERFPELHDLLEEATKEGYASTNGPESGDIVDFLGAEAAEQGASDRFVLYRGEVFRVVQEIG